MSSELNQKNVCGHIYPSFLVRVVGELHGMREKELLVVYWALPTLQ